MARPRRPAQASKATRTAIACATRCARKRKTRRSVKPAPRRPANAGRRRNSLSAPGFWLFEMNRLFAVSLLLCGACAGGAGAPCIFVSLEGVTEYQLAYVLRLLTLPNL